MKKILFVVLFFMISLLSPGSASAWQGVVVRVIDGDSLKIRHGKTIKEIRLYGINAPEYGQPYGNKARRFLRSQVLNKRVIVNGKDIDRHGRLVALVSYRGELINQRMVRQGLAWVSSRYCKIQPLCRNIKKDEREARKAKRGLWRDPSALPPWRWKRLSKK